MLELHPRSLGGLGDETDLHLAGLREIGLDLPLRRDVPADEQPVRGLVREDAGPAADAPVDAAVVDVTSDAPLEDGLGDRDA